jgi:hypothetical protein
VRSQRLSTIAVAACLAGALAACSSSASPVKHSVTSAPAAGKSPQIEVNPPGDIPDTQAFVPFKGAGFTVTVPEGWAQTAGQAGTIFSDKYNSITLASAATATAPTVTSAQSTELPTIRSAAKGYVAGSVKTVSRTAGPAILMTYKAQSSVNPVTGKIAVLAVERYEFWRAGREVILTLAAPVGSDNVDPWRKVTDSFTWTGK